MREALLSELPDARDEARFFFLADGEDGDDIVFGVGFVALRLVSFFLFTPL